LNPTDGLCYDSKFITTTKSMNTNGAYTITSVTCNVGDANNAGYFWSAKD